MSKRQCLTANEAVEEKKQHVTPCSDCPFARTALPGWLALSPVGKWLLVAHGEGRMECHTRTIKGEAAQCAGAAIFRANVFKWVPPGLIKLPKNTTLVFGGDTEFASHHLRKIVTGQECLKLKLAAMEDIMAGKETE